MTTSLPPDYATLAGFSDAVLRERTGEDWAFWVAFLHERGAADLDHAAIVDLIDPAIDRWWAQSIVVGFERLIGRRAVGQVKGGTFTASKSATLPVGLERARAACSRAERAEWLPIPLDDRPTTSASSLRFDLPDGSRAALWFTDKGPDKTGLSVNIEGLADTGARDAAKEAWGRYLAALKAWVRRP